MTIRQTMGAAGVLALGLLLAAPGGAQAQEGFEFEARGGIPFSSGDHAVAYDQGWSAGAALNWWVLERVGVRVDADLLRFSPDDEANSFPNGLPKSTLFNGHLGGAAKLTPPGGSVLFQINGSAGMTMFDSGDIGEPDVNDTFFSVAGGAQLGFPFGGAVVGVDARVYYIFSDPDSLCPLTQYIDELDVDPTTCAASGPSSVDAMDSIVAYPISLFVRFGF